ncbi:hypothetical protein K505DRAFT_115785 [Melanomma pulvis-pyrius CBS 109.77]|uniref:Uncharacterized protein n=1 Tax=Melanomma pulvis-pyrius CBS 109.77 TaxID=1314802 RepID=A0A6A6WWQ4_9PLEO|nr:hypothetical protein K505DRAFT_115785 [Melanomma pulvis-pyrius CBS 109.77]
MYREYSVRCSTCTGPFCRFPDRDPPNGSGGEILTGECMVGWSVGEGSSFVGRVWKELGGGLILFIGDRFLYALFYFFLGEEKVERCWSKGCCGCWGGKLT